MKRRMLTTLVAGFATAVIGASSLMAHDDDDDRGRDHGRFVVRADLVGFQEGVSAGVSFFLCSNLGNGPAGTQACPAPPAEVTGVITPELVIGPAGQGIEAGAFAEIVAALGDDTA